MSAATIPWADPMCPLPARISEVVRETHDTYTLTAMAADGVSLPSFLPGQFSMVCEYGAGEVPISISGDAEIAGQLIYTIRAVGKVTEALVRHKPGDYIGIRGSFGTAWPVEAARGRDVLLIAGGIGLAPLRPVISHIARHRSDYGRFILLYGARTPKDLLFRKQLRAWSTLPETEILVTVDCADSKWRGHVGVVTKLFDFAALWPDRTIAMTCGPEIMMRFVIRALRDKNFETGQIHLSMERNMKCAIGFCGHCQMGPFFICKDGPVFAYPRIERWIEGHHEL
ncbi:MAG: FAD/NAD(P)-binding protein [Bryobacteraceae bacterium]